MYNFWSKKLNLGLYFSTLKGDSQSKRIAYSSPRHRKDPGKLFSSNLCVDPEMCDLLPQNYIFVFCWFGSQLAPPAPRITLKEHKALRVIKNRKSLSNSPNCQFHTSDLLCSRSYLHRFRYNYVYSARLGMLFRTWGNLFDLTSPHLQFLEILVDNAFFFDHKIEHNLII